MKNQPNSAVTVSRPSDPLTIQGTLADTLPYLRELKRIQDAAIRLRDKGLAAALCVNWKAVSRGNATGWETVWEIPDDPTSAVLIRRLKHLAYRLGYIGDDEKLPGIPSWSDIGVHALNETALFENDRLKNPLTVSLYATTGAVDDAPRPTRMMFAAHYLRARLDDLEADGAAKNPELPKEVVRCYFAILKEIYVLQPLATGIGSVRAGGPTAISSTFTTSESARALLHLARSAERTASFLEQLARSAEYIELVEDAEADSTALGTDKLLDANWAKTELSRLQLALESLIAGSAGHVLIPLRRHRRTLRSTASRPLSTCVRDITKDAVAFLRGSAANVVAVLREGQLLHQTETASSKRKFHTMKSDTRAALNISVSFQEWRACVLSESAHKYVHGRLSLFSQTWDRESQELAAMLAASEQQGVLSRALSRISEGLRAVGAGIVDLLAPVRSRMEATLHAALFGIHTTGSTSDYAELSFASQCLGSLTRRWDEAVFSHSLRAIEAGIDDGGSVSQGRPFMSIGSSGAALHPVNAQVLRATLNVAANVPGPLSTSALARMLRYFESGAQDTPLGDTGPRRLLSKRTGKAWKQQPGDSTPRVSSWVTAVSVLALHRLVETVGRKLNDAIATFVRFERADESSINKRSLSIDDMMCSDIGLASTLPNRRMTTALLEHLRSHLATGTPRRDSVHSLILYGPPGTGKTTLVKALAASASCNLVTVTPSDFLVRGEDALELQSVAVMEALSLLSSTVIFFDEFDPVIHSRAGGTAAPTSVFSFLTGSMLPKLSDLYAAARERRNAYVLATNHVHHLDEAAIRSGRFDVKMFVFPPDVPSRACRLTRLLREFMRTPPGAKLLKSMSLSRKRLMMARLAAIVAWTGGVSIESLVGRLGFLPILDSRQSAAAFNLESLPRIWRYILLDELVTPAEILASIPMPVDSRSGSDPQADVGKSGLKSWIPVNELEMHQVLETMLTRAWDAALLDRIPIDEEPSGKVDWKASIVDSWDGEPGKKHSISKTFSRVLSQKSRELRAHLGGGDQNIEDFAFGADDQERSQSA